ncbi:MAG: hypothetical protein PHV07_04810 [Oscillospiraceae bacterium]|nr:hypothetical protein [Oscillospiraceae bacterium]
MSAQKKRLNGISAGIILSISICFMLCFYAPLELFLTNQDEFWFDLKTIILPVSLLFVATTIFSIIIFALVRIISKKLYYFSLAAGFTILISCYIQGNFMIGSLPALDGTNIDWSSGIGHRVQSIVLWADIASLVAFIIFKFKIIIFRKVTFIGSLCLLLMLSVTLSTLLLTTNIKDNNYSLSVTDKNEFQFSTDKNVIVLMLDAVNEKDFVEVINADPDFAEDFKDFTHFDNVASGYPFTQMAVPFALTGEWCENDKPYVDYIEESFNKSPIINHLEKQNYKIGIYDDGEFHFSSNRFAGRFENQLGPTDTYSSLYSCMKLMVKMAGIKYAPWDAKRFCYNLIDHSKKIHINLTPDADIYNWSNSIFYPQIKDKNPITTTDDKCFRFIHIEGAHTPYQYDKDVNLIDGSEASYESNLEACVTICKKFIQRIKESNIYDNSAIVIMADHGFDKYIRGNLLDRANPIMLIKGINETNDKLITSSAPISHEDFPQALIKLTENKKSTEVFDSKDGDNSKRRFLFYDYTREYHMVEYFINGRADNTESMKPTGKIFDYVEKDNLENPINNSATGDK